MEIDYEQRNKDLQELINRDWQDKVGLTIAKLMEFYVRTEGNCYLSCSGGADSMVLYDICKKVEQMNGWKFKVVFSDTGLEDQQLERLLWLFLELQWFDLKYHSCKCFHKKVTLSFQKK